MDDQHKLNELIRQESTLNASLAASSLALNEAHASDEWSDEKANRFLVDSAHHRNMQADLDRVRGQRIELEGKAERARQAEPREVDMGPLHRWLWQDEGGLSEDEISRHLTDPDDETRRAMGRQSRPGFRIAIPPEKAMLDRQLAARNTLGPVMAGDVAVRSDITAGDGAAGAAVPEFWDSEVIERLAYFGSIEPFCSTFVTDSGGDFHINNMDGVAEKGAAIGQADPNVKPGSLFAAAALPTVGETVMKAYKRTSSPIWIKRDAENDVHFSLNMRAEMYAERRLSRGFNEWFVKGDNATKPQGIVTVAGAGVTAAAEAEFTYDELVDLKYSVNRAYRENTEGMGGFMGKQSGRTGWIGSDDWEKSVVSMKDSDGRPLWTPSIMAGNYGMTAKPPDLILGYPYLINGEMDAVVADKVPCMFGNFSYYGIRTVNSIEIFRFWDALTALNDSTMCIGFARRDGRGIGAFSAANVTEAFKKLTMK